MKTNFDYTKTYYKITNKEDSYTEFYDDSTDMFDFFTIKDIFTDLIRRPKVGYYVQAGKIPEGTPVNEENGIFSSDIFVTEESRILNLDTIKYLESNGADIHASNDNILRWVAARGDMDIYNYLKEEKKMDIHQNAEFALQLAAQYGHFDIVKNIVDDGGDIHARNNYSLRVAYIQGHKEIVNYLFDKHSKSTSKFRITDMQELENNPNLKRGARIYYKIDRKLILAAIANMVKMAETLTELGADVHTREESPLCSAISFGKLDTVKFFIERGADVTVPLMKSSLELAKNNGHMDVVEYIESIN